VTGPLPTKDRGTLRTIGEACDYMTGMGKKREWRTHWQRVCKLVLAKEDVMTVSRALELGLFMYAMLDVSKATLINGPTDPKACVGKSALGRMER
jgi:hypothetical protein